jgi:hypothetical protein
VVSRARKFRQFRRKRALWSARENSIEVITDIRHIWIIAE